MKLECVEDKYLVEWFCHYDKFCLARKWCAETFGYDWGSCNSGQLDRHCNNLSLFTFKRMYHAQWFIMRWNIDANSKL